MSRGTERGPGTEYGEAWTYESIVGAIPGLSLSARAALALQFVLFEGALLVLAALYDLWDAVPAGTAAVVVATAGSGLMLALANRLRVLHAPASYRRLLFGSSIEVVLGVLAYAGLLTYLFVYDAGDAPLFDSLLGPEPPLPAAYLALLILWDVCYRIGTGWWASVTGLWFVVRYREEMGERAPARLRRIHVLTVAFASLQVILLPFVGEEPVLVAAVGGHVLAVMLVSGASILLTRR